MVDTNMAERRNRAPKFFQQPIDLSPQRHHGDPTSSTNTPSSPQYKLPKSHNNGARSRRPTPPPRQPPQEPLSIAAAAAITSTTQHDAWAAPFIPPLQEINYTTAVVINDGIESIQ
jgi:hypothetical protein